MLFYFHELVGFYAIKIHLHDDKGMMIAKKAYRLGNFYARNSFCVPNDKIHG